MLHSAKRTRKRGIQRVKACKLLRVTSWVLKSSKEAQKVNALAVEGEERRGSLRKASGSWQTSFDPEISEWGNPIYFI